jgi:hypothetical protein
MGTWPVPITRAHRVQKLIIPILAAAQVNLDKFDFANRPGGLIFIGAYIAALVGILMTMAYSRSQRSAGGRLA